jgi:hypothetical protein
LYRLLFAITKGHSEKAERHKRMMHPKETRRSATAICRYEFALYCCATEKSRPAFVLSNCRFPIASGLQSRAVQSVSGGVLQELAIRAAG